MKALSAVFFSLVGVVAISFVMSIVTGVREHRAKENPAPLSIPVPAIAH